MTTKKIEEIRKALDKGEPIKILPSGELTTVNDTESGTILDPRKRWI